MTDDMDISTNIKQETVSKSEASSEFDDSYSYAINNYDVKVKLETCIVQTDIDKRGVSDYKYDSVKRETFIFKEIKEEPKQEIEEDYSGQYDVGLVVLKQDTDDPTRYLESDNDKKVSPLCISQAKALPDDKHATPTDILMALKNNNYGLLSEYVNIEY